MDIKLTPNGGSPVYLDMLPETVKYTADGKFMTYSIIGVGDVKVPSGTVPDTISWNATFPGASRKKEPYVKKNRWQSPQDYIKKITSWRNAKTKVNVQVVGAGINLDCSIEKFNGKFSGGHGDFIYDIQFVKYQKIEITAVPPSKSGKSGKGKSGKGRPDSKKKKKQTSKSNPKTRTYTVKRGDSLWRIASMFLGNGARYGEIYRLNKRKIDSHHGGPNMIWPGDRLTIPAR